MKTVIICDCEFLAAEGSPRRYWCGPMDPDPVVVQIGAVKLGLEDDCEILDTISTYVVPRDRRGQVFDIDPFFTQLTGISNSTIDEKGVSLEEALANLDTFSEGAKFWSWGKDELNMLAISCFVAGISPPIRASRFDNACKLVLKAGMPQEDLAKTRSTALASYYNLDHRPLVAHEALDDALSVALALQHLLRRGLLKARDLTDT